MTRHQFEQAVADPRDILGIKIALGLTCGVASSRYCHMAKAILDAGLANEFVERFVERNGK